MKFMLTSNVYLLWWHDTFQRIMQFSTNMLPGQYVCEKWLAYFRGFRLCKVKLGSLVCHIYKSDWVNFLILICSLRELPCCEISASNLLLLSGTQQQLSSLNSHEPRRIWTETSRGRAEFHGEVSLVAKRQIMRYEHKSPPSCPQFQLHLPSGRHNLVTSTSP